jgi:hypothetical protein
MTFIEQLQRLIIEQVKETKDPDLLDLVHKILLAETV